MTRLLAAQLACLFAHEASKLPRRSRSNLEVRMQEAHLIRTAGEWAKVARITWPMRFPLTAKDLPAA